MTTMTAASFKRSLVWISFLALQPNAFQISNPFYVSLNSRRRQNVGRFSGVSLRDELFSQNDRNSNQLDNSGGVERTAANTPIPQSFRRLKKKKNRKQRYVSIKPHVRQKKEWLEKTTLQLLESETGSLINGKWHQAVSMMNAWSSLAKSDPVAPVRIEALLKRLLDEKAWENNRAKVQLDMTIYNRVLDAWACAAIFDTVSVDSSLPTTTTTIAAAETVISSPRAASQRAREILVLLQENYDMTKDDALLPNRESFSIVLHMVCRIEGALIARRILAWMEYLHKSNKNIFARPQRDDYIVLLDAYANCPDPNAGKLAEAFIRHMISIGVPPDTLCYNIAIKAWNKTRRGREAAEHADCILDEMQMRGVVPDDFTFVSVISAWAASGMRAHAVTRVEALLEKLQKYTTPTTIVMNAVMSAWVKSKTPQAVHRTQEILQQMEESSSGMRPDLVAYNTHLHALSIHAQKNPEYALQAQELLDKMINLRKAGTLDFGPNLFSYNLVIEAYCRSHQPMRAAEILGRLVKSESVEPDAFSFNQVLSVLSRSTGSVNEAVRIVEQLLKYMNDSYESGVHPNARPDVITYGTAIFAFSRSGEKGAAERAEALLETMKQRYSAGELHLKPNRICYNLLIDCWARSGEGIRGARKAEALLHEMQRLHEVGDDSLAPNLVTYNSVLNAWARSGTRCCGHKAEFYLNRMWELYNAGNERVKPNYFSYNTVINAISKSKNEGKAQKALRILRRMDKLYRAGNKEARPNEITYTAVLNSCAFPAAMDGKTRRKALHTAIFTLEELQASRYGQPNQVTYGTFIKACANLLPEDDALRRKVIQTVFQQCCKDGQCGEMVLNYLRKAAPFDLYEELFADVIKAGAKSVSVEDLPYEWRCNVRDKDGWRDKPGRRRRVPRDSSTT